MIYDTLPCKDGVDFKSKLRRANLIAVTVRYSTDGHYRETLWIEYSLTGMALYMLELILNNSEEVISYTVYGDQGQVLKEFDPKTFPKRI